MFDFLSSAFHYYIRSRTLSVKHTIHWYQNGCITDLNLGITTLLIVAEGMKQYVLSKCITRK